MNVQSSTDTQRSQDIEEPSEWLSSNLGSNSEDEEEEGRGPVQLQGHFTSSDLLNPSDALDLLAHVADMEPEGHDHNQSQETVRQVEGPTNVTNASSQAACNYPPIVSGALSLPEVSFLIEQ